VNHEAWIMKEKLTKQENKPVGMPELDGEEAERIKAEFHKFYPEGGLEMIDKEEVPAEVMAYFMRAAGCSWTAGRGSRIN